MPTKAKIAKLRTPTRFRFFILVQRYVLGPGFCGERSHSGQFLMSIAELDSPVA